MESVKESPFRLQYFVICSLFFYRLNDCLSKILVAELGSFELLFFRSLFAILLLPIFFTYTSINFKSFFEQRMLLRNALAGFALLCEIASLKYLSLSIFILLAYTAPFFMKLFARIFLKEKLSALEIVIMFISLLGVVCIIDITLEEGQWEGIVYALLGAVLYALSLVVTKTVKTKDSHSIYFSYIIVLFFISLLRVPADFPSELEFFLLFMMAVIHMAAFYLFLKGFMLLKTSRAAVLEYLGIIFAIGFDYLVWNIFPSFLQFVGGGLIIGGSVISIYREKLGVLFHKFPVFCRESLSRAKSESDE